MWPTVSVKAPDTAKMLHDVLGGQRADFVAVGELDLDCRMGDAETGVQLVGEAC